MTAHLSDCSRPPPPTTAQEPEVEEPKSGEVQGGKAGPAAAVVKEPTEVEKRRLQLQKDRLLRDGKNKLVKFREQHKAYLGLDGGPVGSEWSVKMLWRGGPELRTRKTHCREAKARAVRPGAEESAAESTSMKQRIQSMKVNPAWCRCSWSWSTSAIYAIRRCVPIPLGWCITGRRQ